MKRLERIELTSTIVIVGFLAATIVCYVMGYYFKLGFPYNCFIGIPGIFRDFEGMRVHNALMDPFRTTFSGFGNNYPPFAYLIVVPFTQIPGRLAFFAYYLFFVFSYWYFLWKTLGGFFNQHLPWWCFGALAFLTYPFQFSLDRLNAENAIVVCVFLFYIFYTKKHYIWSAIFLGAAAAAKAYPAMFILIFLSDKRFKELFVFAASVVFFTALSLKVFHVSLDEVMLAYRNSYQGFHDFVLSRYNVNYGSSLFNLFQTLLALIVSDTPGNFNPVTMGALFNLYVPFALLLLSVISFLTVVVPLQLWQRLTVIAAAIIVIPQTSFDYKLCYLYVPLVAFLSSETPGRFSKWITVLLALMLVPKTYWPVIKGTPPSEFLHIFPSVLINPVILLALIGLIFYEQIPSLSALPRWTKQWFKFSA